MKKGWLPTFHSLRDLQGTPVLTFSGTGGIICPPRWQSVLRLHNASVVDCKKNISMDQTLGVFWTQTLKVSKKFRQPKHPWKFQHDHSLDGVTSYRVSTVSTLGEREGTSRGNHFQARGDAFLSDFVSGSWVIVTQSMDITDPLSFDYTRVKVDSTVTMYWFI